MTNCSMDKARQKARSQNIMDKNGKLPKNKPNNIAVVDVYKFENDIRYKAISEYGPLPEGVKEAIKLMGDKLEFNPAFFDWFESKSKGSDTAGFKFPSGMFVFSHQGQKFFVYSMDYNGSVYSQILPFNINRLIDMYGYTENEAKHVYSTVMDGYIREIGNNTLEGILSDVRERSNDIAINFRKSEVTNLQEAIDAALEVSNPKSISYTLLKYLNRKGAEQFANTEFNVDLLGRALNTHGAMGYYNPYYRKVGIDPVAMATSSHNASDLIPMVIAHEAVHVLTVDQLRIYQRFAGTEELGKHLNEKQIEAAAHLFDLYDRIVEHTKNSNIPLSAHYGLSSVYEMVAEAQTNAGFVDYLNSISDDIVGDDDRSLLEQIFDAIGRLLSSIFNANDSELTLLINGLSLQLMEAQNPSAYQDIYKVIIKENLFGEYALKPGEDIKEISRIIKSNGSHYRYSEEELLKKFFRKVTNPLNAKRELNMFGETISFRNLSDAEINQKLKNEVIERIMSFEANVMDNMVKWLNSGANKDDYGEYMKTTYRDAEHPDINQKLATHILIDHLEFDFNEKAYRLDSEEIKNLGINVPGFVGFNPIVLVHDTEQGEKAVSLMDVTNVPINERTNEGIFDSIKDFTGLELPNAFKSNELGLRRFLLTLTAMAIKAQNPNITIRKAGIVQVAGKASKLMSDHINLQETVQDIQTLTANPEVRNILGQDVQKLLDTPGIFNPELYDINYISWFMHWSRAKQQAIKEGVLVNEETTYSQKERNQAAWRYGLFADHIGKALSEDEPTERMLEFFINRQKFLENYKYAEHTTKPDVTEAMNNDKEYQLVSQSIIQLSKMVSSGSGRLYDITRVGNYLRSQQNIDNPIAQFALISLQEGMQRTRTQFMKRNEQLAPVWKSIDSNFFLLNPEKKYVAEVFTDLSSDRFKRLFKKEKFNHQKGLVEGVTDKIHWDMNDPETKEAVRSGQLTAEDVESGKQLSNHFKELLIKFRAHELMQERKALEVMSKEDSDKFKKEVLQLATKEIEAKYQMGKVLTVSKSAKEMFFKGNVKEAITRMLDDVMNPERYYSEGKGSDILTGTDAARYYTNQLLSEEDDFSRMEKFGLELKDGEVVLTDEKKLEASSQDLEVSLKLFAMAVEKTIQTENYMLPRVNAARSALYAYENSRGEKMKNTREYLFRRFQMLINGNTDLDALKNIMLELPVVGNVRPVSMAMGLQGSMVFGQLAGNIGSGVTATLVNAFGVLGNTVANTSSPFKAGYAETAEAIKEFMFNHDKVIKVVTKYQLVDTDTLQLIHGDRKGVHTEFRKDMWNGHVFQWLNWAPDYAARCVTSVAQMIKDGTWQAIDKEGNYNEDLDPRYKEKDGKILREFRKKKLIEEGHMDANSTKLTLPYIDREILAIRDQSSQQVVGGYMSDERSNSGYKIYGRFFDTYKRWLYNKLTNLYSKPYEREVSGRLTVKEGKAVWENEYFEGKLQTLNEVYKILKKQYSNPVQAWHDMQQLKPKQKENLKRLMVDTMLWAVLTMAFRGAFDDDDKPGNVILGRTIGSNSLMKSLYYASQDLTNEWYPPAITDLVSEPFAALIHAKKLALLSEALITFDSDRVQRELWKVAPFVSSVKYVDNIFGEE